MRTSTQRYTKEQIAQANSINLIDYAAKNGYVLEDGGRKALRVKHSGGLYLFKESNRFYHHTTEKRGGPIDFVMQFENRDFLQAVEHLLGEHPNIGAYAPPPIPPKRKKANWCCRTKHRITSAYIGISALCGASIPKLCLN